MAPLSSLQFQSFPPHITPSFTRFKKPHDQNVIFCKTNQQDLDLCLSIEDQSLKVQRRDLLLHTVFGSLCLPAMVPFAFAEEEGFQIYSDDVNKFKIMIPQDWQIGGGEGNGFKSVTAFYPSEASNSNVSVVITGLGADFTKLESFGKVDAFAENLVSGLDRSWQRPPGVSAKLIDSKVTKGMYYIEYTLRNPGESERHLYSVLGIANNGWYNRLYTLTGQYLDEESEKYRSKIEKAVASFKLV
ncbi:psbP domain-containing protein 3, chloroplastic isoform X2 [Cynara cardunculus var. scolymus]|uniref:psbP domain-containing protein 3, chloroplastic isoform X2 n=1 Tax=Cynara cardunculus var. scolymus TaxID=59895 RepID=UPI000D630119|nr:psbP domain-containing protein 3, chloroplastic isoform X2 [Cynara cardunculus var. scolymus]